MLIKPSTLRLDQLLERRVVPEGFEFHAVVKSKTVGIALGECLGEEFDRPVLLSEMSGDGGLPVSSPGNISQAVPHGQFIRDPHRLCIVAPDGGSDSKPTCQLVLARFFLDQLDDQVLEIVPAPDHPQRVGE